MELKKITIQKFKSISNLDLNLSQINFLVGGNNAGKSSVLQAIHTAVTAAQTSTEMNWKIISDNLIKYSPTGNFADIGHNGPLENMSTGRRAAITFKGLNDEGDNALYKIELYKGRNTGAGVERSASVIGFSNYITKTNPPFSIYVPGLAGIPHFEEYKNPANVIRKIAGGEANSVLRNILLMIKKKKKLSILKERMCEVFPFFDLRIEFDENKHQHIDVCAITKKNGEFKALDLVGTGVLQALQLFAYTIYFEPALLLLDEPDSHLHPSNQQQLINNLNLISQHTNTKIILATHSRHMINNLPENAEIFWLENGKIKANQAFDKIKLLNDLGALDQADEFSKDLLILTEDNDKKLLFKLLRQMNVPTERIGIASYNGISNYKIAIQLTRQLLRDDQKLIVHRDRDFLTDSEIGEWEQSVINFNAVPYVTEGSDLEMCFIDSEHLAELANTTTDRIEEFITSIINDNYSSWYKKFKDKRRDHNNKIYPDGGSPLTDSLCSPGENLEKRNIVGKLLLSKIRERSGELLGIKIDPLKSSDVTTIAPILQQIISSELST